MCTVPRLIHQVAARQQEYVDVINAHLAHPLVKSLTLVTTSQDHVDVRPRQQSSR